MADVCFDCTDEMWGEENAPRNDMVRDGGPGHVMALCEGCGYHAFNAEGKRKCGRPQADFTDDAIAVTPGWPLCFVCFPSADEEG